jgi:hypothetical protein
VWGQLGKSVFNEKQTFRAGSDQRMPPTGDIRREDSVTACSRERSIKVLCNVDQFCHNVSSIIILRASRSLRDGLRLL